MKDHLDYLTYLTLVLLVGLGILGFSTYDKERFEGNLEREERSLERVEWEARAERCFREAYSELYAVKYELMTDRAEIYFSECLNR